MAYILQKSLNSLCEFSLLILVCVKGGGTAAHLMLDLWPSLQLEGWEIDYIV